MDSLMEIFMLETNEFLSKIEEILISSEKAEDGLIQATPEIFRIMHTIKSSAAMMSLGNISQIAHKVEDLFYYLRENKGTPVDTPALTDILLDAVDFIKRNLDGTANEDPAEKIKFIQAFLDGLKQGGDAAKAAPAVEAAPPPPPPPEPEGIWRGAVIRFKADCAMPGLRAFELQNRIRRTMPGVRFQVDDPSEDDATIRENGLTMRVDPETTNAALRDIVEKSPFVEKIEFPKAEASSRTKDRAPAEAVPTIEPSPQYVDRRSDSPTLGKAFANVEIVKLDNLVDLVGELLIRQMELAQDFEQRDWHKGSADIIGLKRLILTLQEAALSTRMLPVRDTFMKMNRLVRDMCRKQNKSIDLVITGEETEVDRSIINHLAAPLMHILRNSIDHGIESVEERVAVGKLPVGRIELSAYTEGRNVVIAVTDDGQGFDTDRILEKALASGIVSQAQAAIMSEEDIHGLVFMPGFSTNQEVTEYSGRGVGMDVVDDSMRQMNGKVIVRSERGQGTRILMKIPLTLAIIDTIIIRVGEESCAIPVSSVNKILFMNAEDSVRNVNGEDVALIDGKCYRILNLFDFYTFAERVPYSDGIMIVVGGDVKQYVVFASEILDRQDVVVKPAPPMFRSIRGIAGCTILGNGRISLILDTDELLTSISRKGART